MATTSAMTAAATAAPKVPHVIRLSLGILALVAGAAALSIGQALFLPIVLAVLLALLLTPLVGLAGRIGLPAWLGALVVVVALVALLVGAVTQLAAPAERWLSPRSPEWRKLETRIQAIKGPLEKLRGAQQRVTGIADAPGVAGRPREVVVERSSLFATLGGVRPVLVGTLSTAVLLFFLLASGDMFLRKLIRVLPSLADRKTAVGIARTIQSEIGRYFFTIAMINAGLGVVTAALMALLGMPSPVFWGVVVGVLNFVPYAGPGASLVLLSAGAVVSLDDWTRIAAVPLCFLALILIEGQIVQPLLVGRRLRLNVVVTFLAVLVWGWLWGLGGVVVAIPILVVLKICADHVPSMSAIGEFVSRE